MELGIYTAIYVGKNGLAGFQTGKQYIINIAKNPNACYNVTSLEENLFITYASEISIRQNWELREKI